MMEIIIVIEIILFRLKGIWKSDNDMVKDKLLNWVWVIFKGKVMIGNDRKCYC